MPNAAHGPHDVEVELTLVDALVQLSFLIQGVLGRAAADVGLAPAQMRLLGVLRGREPAMSEIARHLDLDRSSVSGLVDRAERRGFVVRLSSTDDGRSIRVALTPGGQRLADDVTREVGRRVDELVEGLSASDTKQLASLAGRLVGASASA